MGKSSTDLNEDVIERVRIGNTKYLRICAFILFNLIGYSYVKYCFTSYVKEEMEMTRIYFKYFSPCLLPIVFITNLYFAAIYYIRLPFFEQFKANSVPWPWEEDPKGWSKKLVSCFKAFVTNQLLVFPAVFVLIMMFFKCDVSVTHLPSLFTFLWQLIASLVIDDFFFYFGHRLLHHPYLYVRFHKQHHEFQNTVSYAAVYTHWVEFVITNALSVLSPLMLFQRNMHLITLAGFIFNRIVGTYETHSGYEFPWSPFKFFAFNAEPAFHNYHHLKNMGNYGAHLWVWDYFFKTSEHFYEESGLQRKVE